MEIVTADGQFLTASENSNPELFWALRGGGGSTFGVVTSMVLKAFPKIPVTTLTFVLTTGKDVLADQFWQTLRAVRDSWLVPFTSNLHPPPPGPVQSLRLM